MNEIYYKFKQLVETLQVDRETTAIETKQCRVDHVRLSWLRDVFVIVGNGMLQLELMYCIWLGALSLLIKVWP